MTYIVVVNRLSQGIDVVFPSVLTDCLTVLGGSTTVLNNAH